MIAREDCNWQCVATYCDVGQSGRDLKNASEFQQMIRDIGAGLIIVDLIVVDTSDRFGRAAELEGLRRLMTIGQVVMIVIAD
jgi:DNA invertase Pin-like site-specific DNA recombinase